MNANHLPTLQTTPASSRPAPFVEPKEILVAIDFSPASVKALHHAAALAAREHANLTLVNVVNEPASFRTLDQAQQEHHQHHEHAVQLQQLARHELEPGVTARVLVRQGDPATEIKRAAAQKHASAIVISRHSQHGLGHWFHPHTANRVINHAPCPVVVVDEN